MDIGSVASLFDNWADSYDADVAAGKWGFDQHGAAIQWICAQLQSKPGSNRIIDLGCGTGMLAEQLMHVQPSMEYIGVDTSKRMLTLAKTKCPATSFIHADMRDYSSWIQHLDPEHVCTVASSYALHHIKDVEKIEVIRRLFEASKRSDFRFVIVDYAFLDIYSRRDMLRVQREQGNLHIVEEIESEHYGDLSFIVNALAGYHIDVRIEKNGIWDWRILCVRNGTTLRSG